MTTTREALRSVAVNVLLHRLGPMTTREIAEQLNLTIEQALSACLWLLDNKTVDYVAGAWALTKDEDNE